MKKIKHATSGAENCPHCSKCRLFFGYAREINQEMGAALQNLYCRSVFHKCARYYIYERLGKFPVPDDVYPNQEIRAHSIVQEEQTRYS